MIVKIVTEDGKHWNLYEGTNVGLHPKGGNWDDGVDIYIEGSNNSVGIEVEKGSNTQIYLMNDQGKTVDSIYV